MKARFLWFLVVICVFLSAASVAFGQKKVIIGASMMTQIQKRWEFEIREMQKECDKLGTKLLVQWANMDPARQADQVDNLISQGIDVLIFHPSDIDANATIIEKVKKAGIPVISYDNLVKNADIDLFFSRNNREAGIIQVQDALKYIKGKGNIALIKGDPNNIVAREFAEEYHRLLDPLAAKGDIKIVAEQWNSDWSTDVAMKTAEGALAAQNDNIQAFIVTNDSMAIGVVQALKGRGLAGKVFVSGLDAQVTNLQLINQGLQTMSIWTMIDEMAQKAIKAAYELATGKEPEYSTLYDNGFKKVPTISIKTISVNKTNLREFVNKIAPPGWISPKDKTEIFK